MPQFDFEKGGDLDGKYYPPLRPIPQAVKKYHEPFNTAYYEYEPGNATRYEVLFTTHPTYWGQQTVMTVINFRAAMIIPSKMDTLGSLEYMQEKLDLNAGDCYALMPLINSYLEDLGQ